jgi:hypothetical protein
MTGVRTLVGRDLLAGEDSTASVPDPWYEGPVREVQGVASAVVARRPAQSGQGQWWRSNVKG